MPRSIAADAFELHAWATVRLLEVCEALPAEHLATEIPGAYGTMMATLRHLVEGDRFQLWAAGAGEPMIDASGMAFAELRAAGDANASAWRRFLSLHPDGGELAVDVDDGGWRRTATVGLRLAQALQHGIEHRTQIRAALSVLGLEALEVSGWAYGFEQGVLREVLPQ